MKFHQTAFTDGDDPDDTALSSPILLDIVNDDVFEGVEYFQARIMDTSDEFRVRIGQDTVNVTINGDDSELFRKLLYNIDIVPECTKCPGNMNNEFPPATTLQSYSYNIACSKQ